MKTMSYCMKTLCYKKRFFRYFIFMWVLAIMIPYLQLSGKTSAMTGTITRSYFLVNFDNTLATMFIYLIPLIAAMIYGNIFIEERSFLPNLMMRTKLWKLNLCHMILSFLSSFLLFFFFLTLCYFITSYMVDSDGTLLESSSYLFSTSAIESNRRFISLYDMYLNAPEARLMIYNLFISIYAGICSLIAYTISLFTNKKLIVYIGPFVVTMLVMLLTNLSHSLVYFQNLLFPNSLNAGDVVPSFIKLSIAYICVCSLICLLHHKAKEYFL